MKYETIDLRVTFYVEPNPKTHAHKKFLIEKYLREKGIHAEQSWKTGQKEWVPLHKVVIEVI